MLKAFLFAALAALLPTSASAVTIDWVSVGNAGNAADPGNCYAANCGSVSYDYWISKYEVTNAQYAELLNAKAASDPLALYDTKMDSNATYGGITRSGTPGSFTYTAKAGFANKPVTFVSFYDSLRFANWLNNGQGSASTETGAYTLNGGTDTPSNALAVTRNGGANIFLTSENEWYKAAYYSAAGFYFDYPTGSNLVGCVPPNYGAGSAANCGGAGFGSDALTTVGAYVFSASPYGTYDQGGNVWEWNEELVEVFHRGIRGGGAYDGYFRNLAASSPSGFTPSSGAKGLGFRVASLVPEPGTGLLVMSGVLGMALRRKRTAKAL